MNPDSEIRRLLDILPASSRMMAKIVSKPQQTVVIDIPFPLPWARERCVYVNFDLWRSLTKPQRDLLILRSTIFICSIKWFNLNINQGILLGGLVGFTLELVEKDIFGIVVAGSLTAIALARIWQNNQRPELELEADEGAIKVAQRRGYERTEAATYLLEAVENVAKIEGRYPLNFVELIRCQNLRAIGGLSSIEMPQNIREII